MGSRFYGSVSGSAASDATRQGTARSGISGHIRGWNLGVQVIGHADGDADLFDVYITRGSSNPRGEFAFRVEIEEGCITISDVGAALDTLSEEA